MGNCTIFGWRKLIAATVLSVTAACPTAAAEVLSTSKLAIEDVRPEQEVKGKMMSRLITACSFGVQILPDFGRGEMSPRLVRLRDQMAARAELRLSNTTVTINHYSVALYLNNKSTAIIAALGGGILSALIAGDNADQSEPPCTHEKMKAGWFDPADLDAPVSPIVVEVEAVVDGRTYHIDAAYSGQRAFLDVDAKKDQPERDRMMYAALDKANARLIEEILSQSATAAEPGFNGTAQPSAQ